MNTYSTKNLANIPKIIVNKKLDRFAYPEHVYLSNGVSTR